MNTKHVRYTAGVLLALSLLLAIGGAAALVSASPLAQAPSSEGDVVDAAAALPAAEVVGDDPDEEGYTGGPTAAAVEDIASSEPEIGVEGAVAPSAAPVAAGPQPDEEGYTGPLSAAAAVDAPSEEGAAEATDGEPGEPGPRPDGSGDAQAAGTAAAEWSGFHYIFAAGATLLPRTSGVQWTYGGGGCVYTNNTGEILNIHLDVTHGSRIDYVRIYYYDTSAANSTAWLTNYNGAGVFSDLVNVKSSGNSGYGSVVSSYIGHVVDTSARAYVLNWQPSQTGSSMRLCGLRVAYRLPT